MKRIFHLRAGLLLGLLLPWLFAYGGVHLRLAIGTHAGHAHPVHRAIRSHARQGEQHIADEAHVPHSSECAAAVAYTPDRKPPAAEQIAALCISVRPLLFRGAPALLARGCLDGEPASPALLHRAPRGPPSLS